MPSYSPIVVTFKSITYSLHDDDFQIYGFIVDLSLIFEICLSSYALKPLPHMYPRQIRFEMYLVFFCLKFVPFSVSLVLARDFNSTIRLVVQAWS